MKKYIPNLLSSLRILIALIFPVLPNDLLAPSLLLAFITEFLDGYLARKYNWLTKTGKWLDPFADKLLALIVGITFILKNKVTLIDLILIYSRDLTAGVGFFIIFLFFNKQQYLDKFQPAFFGKLTTLFQYLVFFDILLREPPDGWLILVTCILSLMASVQYVFNFFFMSKRSRGSHTR